jgi:predicted AAA+ superfamily ATPase
LRAQVAYAGCGGELTYYRTPSGSEVDFIWSRGARSVGIEVKASARWRPEHSRTLAELLANGTIARGFGVYLGERALVDGPIRVLPAHAFVRELEHGKVLSFGRIKGGAR